ncbi:MAG: glutamyl-tRNA reductase [Candidatus Methylomirabilia bacterium]
MASLFVGGVNHRTAPIALREQLAVEKDKLRQILLEVHLSGAVSEIMILSTCNRVEVYGVAELVSEARNLAFRHLCAYRGVDPSTLEPVLYTKTDAEAVQHSFRVASSLDSMILGEPQILGQVKDAFALARGCQTVGPLLHGLLTQAFAVAKKVRTETGVARHAVSVSYAAVELARKIFGGLSGKSVLLVGTGKMGELAAKHLAAQRAFPIYVANRTWSRAQEVARLLAGTAVPFDQLTETVAQVDIVITSAAASEPIIRRDDVQRALHARRSRPLFFIDIAVPRAVEPGVNDLENVFCYDIDDFRQVVEANIRERLREAHRAEALVEREAGKFLARLQDLAVVPTIVSLREKLESIRQGEVAKALGRIPGASPETRETIEALSSAIVNKILHHPVVKLRDSSRRGRAGQWTRLVSELFGLEGGEDEP